MRIIGMVFRLDRVLLEWTFLEMVANWPKAREIAPNGI